MFQQWSRHFLSAGDQTQIEEGMIIVIDGLIEHKGLLYRSRDTVVITDNGPEILNWYKDWREPYFALNYDLNRSGCWID